MKIKNTIYLILLCLFLLLPKTVQAEDAGKVDMQVTYGFQNNIKNGSCVPVRITLTNSGPDFSGEIEVKIPVQSENNIKSSIWMNETAETNNKEKNCIYKKEVSLKQGQQVNEIFYVELPAFNGYLNVQLLSEEDVLETVQLCCDFDENSMRVLTGVVSANLQDLNELDGMQVNVETYYGTDTFVKAIVLTPDEIYDHPEALEQLDVLIVDEGTEFTRKQQAALDSWKHNGGFCLERGEESLCQTFEQLLSEEKSEDFKQHLEEMGYYSIDTYHGFDDIPVNRKSNLVKYLIVILLYLICIGPGVYWFVRRKAKPYRLVLCVGGLSIGFMILVNILGNENSMRSPYICYRTMYEQHGSYLDESVEFSVQAQHNQDYQLSVDSSYTVFPLNMGIDGAKSVDSAVAEAVTVTYGEEENEILMERMSSYKKNTFELQKNEMLGEEEQIQFEVSGDGEKIDICWENPTEFKLEKVILVLWNRAAVIGDIEPYSEGELSQCELLSVGNSGMEYLLKEQYDFSDEEYFDYAIENYSSEIRYAMRVSREEDACVMGIIQNPYNVFEENRGYDLYGNTFIKIDVEIDWKQDDLTWCPNLEIYGTAKKGEFSSQTNLLNTKEAIIDYNVSFLGDMEYLEFFTADYDDEQYFIPYEGEVSLFNWMTGEFEEIQNWKEPLTGVTLDAYVSESGCVRVHYLTEDRLVSSNRSCMLPYLRAAGKVE